MIDSAALVLVVESNKNKGGGGGYEHGGCRHNLEEEAIKCVESWRKFGNTLKDIPIYAMCCTDNPPSPKTIKSLQDLGVTYIEEYLPISDGFPAGWWNTPLCGKWFEENLTEDLLIHIDLDITLLKELDERIFYHNADESVAKCAVYSDEFPDDEGEINGVPKQFVTCIISSWRRNRFYTRWFDTMMDIWSRWPMKSNSWWNYCNIEEHAVDYMWEKNKAIFYVFNKVQIGCGYDSVESLTDEEFENVYFLHGHLDDPERKVILEKWCRRMLGD